MRYLSVCSGIEAVSVAWHPLGWEAAAFAEIEAFPRAVLKHHWPSVPLHGDFTTIGGDEYGSIDVLVGGTPCQSFSVAGLRGGLADDRGNLSLEFLRLAQRARPKWVVWENVPGVLSSAGGRDFGSILGGLGELGYGWAYRVLDAQFFGVPQRRRRVFVVGYLGDQRRAAAVLFERHSLQGHSPPRRKAREGVAAPINACTKGRSPGLSPDDASNLIANPLRAQSQHSHRADSDNMVEVASTVSRKWAKGSGGYAGQNETENCIMVPAQDPAYPLGACPAAHSSHGEGQTNYAVAFQGKASASNSMNPTHVSPALDKGKAGGMAASIGSAVRRLTPMECERLQGFPDEYTNVPYRNKPASDGPRYKALGNSMAVPVMRWIGERINNG